MLRAEVICTASVHAAVLGVGLGAVLPAQAIVVWETRAAQNYRQCVERLADHDPTVGRALAAAVGRQRESGAPGKWPTDQWTAVFAKGIASKCGTPPRFACEGEPPCLVPDDRPPVMRATDLFDSSRRIGKVKNAWAWLPAATQGR